MNWIGSLSIISIEVENWQIIPDWKKSEMLPEKIEILLKTSNPYENAGDNINPMQSEKRILEIILKHYTGYVIKKITQNEIIMNNPSILMGHNIYPNIYYKCHLVNKDNNNEKRIAIRFIYDGATTL